MAYEFNPDIHIEIPGDKIREAVKAAYDLSVPQGMGFIHAKPGTLTEEEIDAIIANGRGNGVYMDYVHGRACKFNIDQHDGKYYIPAHWYDHGNYLLLELLNALGISNPADVVIAAQTALEEANRKYREARK